MNTSEKRKAFQRMAETAWHKAPGHIRVMAGAYVEPILAAMQQIGNELDEVQRQVTGGCCNGNCKQGRNCPQRGVKHGGA